ncbi:mitochondrial fission ELM1 family protein [Desulfococcaceae bacterium OttesenSCG-928-F15]|nr:mitochondrial fission ELM1 family protein [Desulfococcaceae bacterium OttesenSCG-928-F15]
MIPKPLRILLISDGRPGHEKQSLAMVEAFSRLTLVETRLFRIPEGRPFALLSFLDSIRASFSPQLSGKILKQYGWSEEKFTPDLVIAAGSHTHGALLLFGRHFKAKTLVCMTPGLFVRSCVDLVLSPRHDGLKEEKNIWITLGPPCKLGDSGEKKAGQGLILIGGIDPSSHFWENEKLMEQVKSLLEKKEITNWIISSSPRTPEETEKSLELLSMENSRVSFIPFSKTAKGWVEEAYASSEEAWITADSISMVYEALTAGCRVGVLPVQWRKKENKFQKSLNFLHGAGWIRYPGERDENHKNLPAFDEAGRAAREALRRWWKKN